MTCIQYAITPVEPTAHIFEVVCQIPHPDPRGQQVALPAWIPGSYMIRDFAKHVLWMRAESDGKSLVLEKINKDHWRCVPTKTPLTLRYQVYARDLSVRAAYLDDTQGFFNGSSVFVRVLGQEQQACEVDIHLPAGEVYRNWRVATSLPRVQAEPHAFGRYRADDYEALIDHPVQIGEFVLAGFTASGVRHDIAITGRHRCHIERLCADLQRMCEQHIHFFGTPAPVDYYLFLIQVLPEGYGGLEHRASCALICARDSLPRSADEPVSEAYRDLLSLCSHEYFHTWNVKRIKPTAFVPYDLQTENYTRLLWAFEGITSYYEDLALLRCGLIDTQSFLELLGQKITAVLRSHGRKLQTLTDSSFDAWTKFYQQDENAPNAIVSYYSKGALAALSLDVEIRKRSGEQKSLDDVMRELWQRYGQSGIGVPERGVESLINEMLGQDLSTLYRHLLYSTEELDLSGILQALGFILHLRHAESSKDKGGKPSAQHAIQTSLAIRYNNENGFLRITHVINGGAAQRAGLAAGDLLLAIDGIKCNGDLEKRLSQYRAGMTLELHAFRRDELFCTQVELQDAFLDTAYIVLQEHVQEEIARRRMAWLQGGHKHA